MCLENKEMEQGQYLSVKCPNCGHKLHIIIHFSTFTGRKLHFTGEIERCLSREEFSRFKNLDMYNKLIFSVGLFHQVYNKWPSEKELKKFIGLSVQTISKYINKVHGIIGKQQERGIDGKFESKVFSLNEKGQERFGELVYEILSEKFLRPKKETVHA